MTGLIAFAVLSYIVLGCWHCKVIRRRMFEAESATGFKDFATYDEFYSYSATIGCARGLFWPVSIFADLLERSLEWDDLDDE